MNEINIILLTLIYIDFFRGFKGSKLLELLSQGLKDFTS